MPSHYGAELHCLQLDSVQMMRCFFIRNAVFAVNQMFFSLHTPRKTNMSPENQWLEDVFPIETVPF